MTRFRQLFVFDRCLARVFAELGDRVLLKGGLGLELRLERARTTKDIDLRVLGEPNALLEHLRAAGRRDLGDYLSFTVDPDKRNPEIAGEGIVYEGRRYRAEARLGGKLYGQAFGVDAAFADVIAGEPDTVHGSTILEFVGLPPAQFRLYPRDTHVAEKLHAYTLPRSTPNSRVKDLPDMALLGRTGPFDSATLLAACRKTFDFRKTHELPAALPDPPKDWEPGYARMASDDELPWKTLAEVTQAARAFMDPMLGGEPGRWDHAKGAWTAP